MAINRSTRYPGRWGAANSNYPLGVPKNRTSATSNDGSYFEKDWISDYEAFFGALLTGAGTSPNGSVDTATSSQLYDALNSLIASSIAKPSVSGNATFTNSNNNIALTGIGGIESLEIGDVLQVSGSASNSTEYTVEVITDSNNVIVNQAHAGGTTTKSLTDETSSVTVTLIEKWHSAPLGLGQGMVDVNASRLFGTPYTNNTGRTIGIYPKDDTDYLDYFIVKVDDVIQAQHRNNSTAGGTTEFSILPAYVPAGSDYEATGTLKSGWSELR